MRLFLLSTEFGEFGNRLLMCSRTLKDNARTHTHTQNEKHKTRNGPCAHKGVSNKTGRAVRQAEEQETGSHDISG